MTAHTATHLRTKPVAHTHAFHCRFLPPWAKLLIRVVNGPLGDSVKSQQETPGEAELSVQETWPTTVRQHSFGLPPHITFPENGPLGADLPPHAHTYTKTHGHVNTCESPDMMHLRHLDVGGRGEWAPLLPRCSRVWVLQAP